MPGIAVAEYATGNGVIQAPFLRPLAGRDTEGSATSHARNTAPEDGSACDYSAGAGACTGVGVTSTAGWVWMRPISE